MRSAVRLDPDAGLAEPDGRRRRSLDSRARIVAAMLALVEGGEVAPRAEQVAARAQVGLRTVFRHFDDLDSLYSEMHDVVAGELAQVISRPLKGLDWSDRLLELVERRALAFEKIAPFQRAAAAHRHRSAFLRAGHERLVAGSREALLRELPAKALADPTMLEALDLLLSYETWGRLRDDQRLSPDQARDVLKATVRRLIGA